MEPLGLDAEIEAKLAGKYSQAQEKEALDWVEQVIGEQLVSEEKSSLMDICQSGVVLCRLVNSIVPGAVKSFNPAPKHALEERANIQGYLQACRKALELPEQDLFDIADLHSRKSPLAVLLNVFAVGRQAQVIPFFEGPKLGVQFNTTLIQQRERKQRRAQELAEDMEKQKKKEEEALERRNVAEAKKKKTLDKRFEEEESRADRRRKRRGKRAKNTIDNSSLRHRKKEADVSPVRFGIDAEHQEKVEEKYDFELEAHVMDWLEAVTCEGLDYFYEGLKSGQVLCKLANLMRPNMIKTIYTKNVAMLERENIKAYLHACEAIGLTKMDLFSVSDLYERKGLAAVLQNLNSMARQAAFMPHFPGPQLSEVIAASKAGLPVPQPKSTPVQTKVTEKAPLLPKDGSTSEEADKPCCSCTIL